MADTSIQTLRDLQKSLNASIDSYVTAIEAKSSSPLLQKGVLADISKTAGAIQSTVTEPFERIIAQSFQQTINVALRIAIDLDLFNIIDKNVSLGTLVEKTGAEKRLLFRILRLLTSSNFFIEPEEKIYSGTEISKALTFPPFRDWVKTCFDTLCPIWLDIPSFVAKNGFKDVSDLSLNPTVAKYGANFFDQLAQDPSREADFASAMKIQELAPPEFSPPFPYDEGAKGFSSEPGAVFLVDVGGGRGQYLEKVHRKHPNLPGHNVLQDLATVVADVSKQEQDASNFTTMAHNFFEPQPVNGARYYHLRGILHDWPDESCVQILRQLRSAFKPGYSRLLVHGFIYPEMNCSQFDAMNDICLWTCCGMERTERECHELLGQAGFKIVRKVPGITGPYWILEAETIEP